MKEENKQTLDFYDFVVMVASDQKAASQVLEREPGWLHIKSSTDETAFHYLGKSEQLQFWRSTFRERGFGMDFEDLRLSART